jgi:hypothetical protein
MPILLTAADSIPAPTATYHKTWCEPIDRIQAIGGTAVISNAVVTGAVGAATCSAPDITKATFVNSGQIQAVFALGGGLTVSADAGTAADGAAANAWQVALIQNDLVTASVVVDPEGDNNAAYGGKPTFIMTANFAGMTEQGFLNIWNASPAGALTTAKTTTPTAIVGLTGNAAPGVPAPLAGFASILGSQDTTVVVTFDRNVSTATPSGLYANLNPATGPYTVAAPTQTPTTLVTATTPTGVSTVTYFYNDVTGGIPGPTGQIRFAAGGVVDGASLTASSVVVAETLVAP